MLFDFREFHANPILIEFTMVSTTSLTFNQISIRLVEIWWANTKIGNVKQLVAELIPFSIHDMSWIDNSSETWFTYLPQEFLIWAPGDQNG